MGLRAGTVVNDLAELKAEAGGLGELGIGSSGLGGLKLLAWHLS